MKTTTLKDILENLTQQDWDKMKKYATYRFKQQIGDSEDRVQDMLEALWSKALGMKRYEDKHIEKAEAFLVRCLDNKVIDHLRKKKLPTTDNYETEWFPELDTNLSRIDYHKWLVDKLDNMDEQDAGVFILYNVHGMTYRDIVREYPEEFSYPYQVWRVYDRTLRSLRRSARLEEIEIGHN